jgi:dipeptidase E
VTKRILLLSSSALYGTQYLDHAEGEVRDLLGSLKQLLFVPFAAFDLDAYGSRARERFAVLGYDVTSLHQVEDMPKAVQSAEAIFIGGGNTFRLLKSLYDYGLVSAIRDRVEDGMPYIGSSAGSNVACPTIKTTNDMPIVRPPSFDALGLVQFQVNPHYMDPDRNSKHMGETRERRINEFHEENDTPVVGLREGTMLLVEGDFTTLKGILPARVFRKGSAPIEVEPGGDIDGLLGPGRV